MKKPTIVIKEEIYTASTAEEIEAIAKKDLAEHGCMYYSVCTEALKTCERDTAQCRRKTGAVHMKDGLVLRRWREFREEFTSAHPMATSRVEPKSI
ncbi:MAG: hypothetical protein NC548_12810 [Lachnospiraceae bacterium]|nr:hypothetical protein [Lachnospiraceae bacterium]MCM1230729.1 hypothetical protein [Ruminococcus flavefaciens]